MSRIGAVGTRVRRTLSEEVAAMALRIDVSMIVVVDDRRGRRSGREESSNTTCRMHGMPLGGRRELIYRRCCAFPATRGQDLGPPQDWWRENGAAVWPGSHGRGPTTDAPVLLWGPDIDHATSDPVSTQGRPCRVNKVQRSNCITPSASRTNLSSRLLTLSETIL